jgi:hypothetical protein
MHAGISTTDGTVSTATVREYGESLGDYLQRDKDDFEAITGGAPEPGPLKGTWQSASGLQKVETAREGEESNQAWINRHYIAVAGAMLSQPPIGPLAA